MLQPPTRCAALLGLLLVFPCISAHLTPQYLYIWAGATDAKLARDSLFVVGVRPTNFGKVLGVTETPFNGLEPHHCGITNNGRMLGAGGLLSVLSGLPSILLFDLKIPTAPKYINGTRQPTKGSIPDAVLPTPNNGLLFTMMGSPSGFSPGSIAEYNTNGNLIGEYPSNGNYLNATGFNPHGISADWKRKTMVTVDFIEPGSTLNAVPGPIVARNTARLWDISRRTNPGYIMTKLYNASKFNDAGMLDTGVIGSTGKYFVTAGGGYLYLLDPAMDELQQVFDYGEENRPIGHSQIQVFRNGTRTIATIFAQSKIMLLDTTNPYKPVKLTEVQFKPVGAAAMAGSHFVLVSNDEKLIAVSTYFLAEGAAGKVNAPGDQTVRLFTLDPGAKKIKPHPVAPVLDFKTLMPGKGAFNPHGLAFKY